MTLLDRYLIRNFLQPYLYCIAGFLSIWMIFDISDNISSLIDERVPLTRIFGFYLTQIPQVLVILLPVSLLLALLFCLGRMSRANEIVSMLTAGISIPRILLPLIGAGLLTTLVSTALNYQLAPHAEFARKTFFDQISRSGAPREAVLRGQVFRNRTDDRTWFVQRMRPVGNEIDGVHVVQQDDNDNIVTKYVATNAFFQPDTRTWTLHSGKVIHYDDAGKIIDEQFFANLPITGWSETPFRLSSANLRAEFLSVPELDEYLRFNADFPATLLASFKTHRYYRYALPWTCLIVVFMAAPLGIGYSRRGILSSVAAAILLVFSMNFLTHLFLALGEGDHISAWLAAWTPNLLFAGIGLYLLHLRSTNRDTPLFHPTALWRRITAR